MRFLDGEVVGLGLRIGRQKHGKAFWSEARGTGGA
jgi:hypothetical protein